MSSLQAQLPRCFQQASSWCSAAPVKRLGCARQKSSPAASCKLSRTCPVAGGAPAEAALPPATPGCCLCGLDLAGGRGARQAGAGLGPLRRAFRVQRRRAWPALLHGHWFGCWRAALHSPRARPPCCVPTVKSRVTMSALAGTCRSRQAATAPLLAPARPRFKNTCPLHRVSRGLIACQSTAARRIRARLAGQPSRPRAVYPSVCLAAWPCRHAIQHASRPLLPCLGSPATPIWAEPKQASCRACEGRLH